MLESNQRLMSIGQVARAAGVATTALRYSSEKAVSVPARRTSADIVCTAEGNGTKPYSLQVTTVGPAIPVRACSFRRFPANATSGASTSPGSMLNRLTSVSTTSK